MNYIDGDLGVLPRDQKLYFCGYFLDKDHEGVRIQEVVKSVDKRLNLTEEEKTFLLIVPVMEGKRDGETWDANKDVDVFLRQPGKEVQIRTYEISFQVTADWGHVKL